LAGQSQAAADRGSGRFFSAITPRTVGCSTPGGWELDFAEAELRRLSGVLAPLGTRQMPLDQPPSRETRFGSPLELSRVHWVRLEVVVEVTDLTWTEGGLLRAVCYQGQREDKPARQVIRPVPSDQ
jgi:hypothetical protein